MRARDNPFRTERVLEVRYRLQQGGWEDLFARWESLGRRAAIVGPQGSGKTTLLEDLVPQLRLQGYRTRELRLDLESPRFEAGSLEKFFSSLGPRDVILFDGAEQLGWLAWRSFERRSRIAGGLFVTLHEPGRLPTLLETRTSPELLAGLVEQILGSRSSDVHPLLPPLYEKHRGNLREALRDLYDHYSRVEA